MKDTGPTRMVREIVWQRDRGMCLRCRAERGVQIHHRAPRQKGGTREAWINQPANLVLICLQCHEYIESHRAEAYESGWLIKRTSGERPEEVSLLGPDGRSSFLTDDGVILTIGAVA